MSSPPGEQDQSNARLQGQQRQSNPHPMPCHVFCLFLNGAQASAKHKLWRYFLRQTFYTDEGVIPETSENFTLKFGTRNIHSLVLIISYEYHAAKTYFVTYLRDLVLEILRFSWYFVRCFCFFGGCSGFSGACSAFFGCFWMFRCSWKY